MIVLIDLAVLEPLLTSRRCNERSFCWGCDGGVCLPIILRSSLPRLNDCITISRWFDLVLSNMTLTSDWCSHFGVCAICICS